MSRIELGILLDVCRTEHRWKKKNPGKKPPLLFPEAGQEGLEKLVEAVEEKRRKASKLPRQE